MRLGEQRPRWQRLPPGAAASAGPEAVELAASAGLILDDWQCWWLEHALAERADGDWAAKENVLITGRQSGKNGVLAALELYALVVLADPLVIHSAHEVPTALNHFEFMLELFERTPDLARLVADTPRTNGKEAIVLTNGSTLKFRARGRNSGRGLTAGRLIFDEAFQIPPQSMGALLPTLRAVPNAQLTYASSAPKKDSVVLHSLIRRGRSDDPGERLFYAEWGNEKGTPLDDVDAWYQANPALGIRIDISALHDEYRTLVAGGDEELIAEFAREAVGIAEEPDDGSDRPAKLPAEAWAATVGAPPVEIRRGDITIAYGVTKDGEWSSITIGAGDLRRPYVETIEHREGVGWLPGRLVKLVERWDPIALGCNGAGPAGAQVGPVLQALRQAGSDIEVTQVSTGDYKRACGGFFTDVVEGRLVRPHDGPLTLAGEDAAERPLGDGWAWDWRSATVPISPLESATVARALLPAERSEPVVMPGFVVV